MRAVAATERGRTCPSEAIELFAVCATEDIERGDAKAFSLSRIGETGESRPFPILIVRTHANGYFGYVNSCPHEGIWLNFGAGNFFTPDRAFLKCGRHGSIFEIETGLCIDGPCKDEEPGAARARGGRRRRLRLRHCAGRG